MSYSASRYQTGFRYDPAMRSGAYRPGGVRQGANALAPVYDAPATFGGGGATLGGGAPMLTGAGLPSRGWDSDNNSANQDTGETTANQPGVARGTGNPLDDLYSAMTTPEFAAPAAAMALGGPMALGIGALGTGLAAALRASNVVDDQTARSLFRGAWGSFGRNEAQTVDSWGNPSRPGQTTGNISGGAGGGDLAAPGMESTLDDTATMGSAYGAPANDISNPGFGAPVGSGNFGDGANSGGGGLNDSPSESGYGGETAGMGSSESGVGWRKGGYTGDGGDGRVDVHKEAGPVHEGEFVLRHEAAHHYGPEIMNALNRGAIPRNALAAMAMRRPMHSANHLVQMMARG